MRNVKRLGKLAQRRTKCQRREKRAQVWPRADNSVLRVRMERKKRKKRNHSETNLALYTTLWGLWSSRQLSLSLSIFEYFPICSRLTFPSVSSVEGCRLLEEGRYFGEKRLEFVKIRMEKRRMVCRNEQVRS